MLVAVGGGGVGGVFTPSRVLALCTALRVVWLTHAHINSLSYVCVCVYIAHLYTPPTVLIQAQKYTRARPNDRQCCSAGASASGIAASRHRNRTARGWTFYCYFFICTICVRRCGPPGARSDERTSVRAWIPRFIWRERTNCCLLRFVCFALASIFLWPCVSVGLADVCA